MTDFKEIDRDSYIPKQMSNRSFDIEHLNSNPLKIFIDNKESIAYEGETVLTILLAHGRKEISKNNHNQKIGAYCGMGVCFCCMVFVDNHKHRACKTKVYEGMHIQTLTNMHDVVNENMKTNNEYSL